MTSSYAPSGRRVGLEGPAGRGFNPVQAADQSRNTERQGLIALDSFARAREVDLANRAKNLEGLIGLSETATKFFVERQQGINENDRKLGIADILNGDMQPKPEALLEYRENTQRLKDAAASEQQGLAQLEEQDREAALEIRSRDPVVSAWREYGRAQGTALKAASSAEFLLTNAMESTVENVPIVMPDGSTRMIAPGKAKSPSELNAAWAVVLQGFINEAGLDGLNPLLIAENVSPRIMEIRAKVLDQGLNRIQKEQREQAVEEVYTYLGAAIKNTDLTDPVEIHGLVQDAVQALTDVGVPRGKANEDIYLRMLENADDVDVVTRIENTPIAADGSLSLGTFGTRFGDKLADDARERIITGNEREVARRERAEKVAVDEVVTAGKLELSKAESPAEREAVWTRANLLLEQMRADGVTGAAEALVNWSTIPRRQAGEGYIQGLIEKSRSEPGSVTREQILRAQAEGYLPPGTVDRFDFPQDAVTERLKGYNGLASKAAAGFIKGQLSDSAWGPTDLESSAVVTRTDQLTAELLDAIRQGIAQNPNFTREDANQIVERTLTKASKDGRFILKETRSDRPGFPVEFQAPLAPLTVPVDNSKDGQRNRLDFSTISPASLPAGTVQPRDIVIGGDALKDLEESYNENGIVPPQAIPVIKATGLTTTEFIRTQSGRPRGLKARAQGLQEAILDNPNSTSLEQLAARYQIQRLQALTSGGGFFSTEGIAPETAELLQDMGRLEGGAMGYEAANRGKAGDMPQGVPGLTNMTIDEVLGRQDLHHVGKYQFQLGRNRTLDLLKNKLGLSGSEKFTPELQDRMASELMWGGWKRPALTAYLKGGGSLEAAATAWNNEWEIGRKGFDVKPHLKRMRAAYVVRGPGAVGRTANFSKQNIASVSWESPGRGDSYQPGGLDLVMEDRQAPALGPGKVVDTGDRNDGYGRYVLVEKVDPATGQPVFVQYSHLDQIYVKKGDRVKAGSIVGKQGFTGTVKNAPIGLTSIDSFVATPDGRNSYQTYPRHSFLRELAAPLGIR